MLRSVVTIGVLDGVHIGHASLVRSARDMARRLRADRVLALSFDPHPLTLIRPQFAPSLLSSFSQRERWLKAHGCDDVIRLVPTPELLGLDPAEFLAKIAKELGVVGIVEGPDFHFGKNRSGDVQLLQWLGQRMGIEVQVAQPVSATLNDHSIVRASSTMVRTLLANGRVADVATMLGRPYEIEGVVKPGDRRGRTIGFPTANIVTAHTLPGDAVYAASVTLPGGASFPAAVNVGARPTFAGAARTLEAHILFPNRDTTANSPWQPITGLPEYDWPITLRFTHWLRDQCRFASLDALKAQLNSDCQRVIQQSRDADPGFEPSPFDPAFPTLDTTTRIA